MKTRHFRIRVDAIDADGTALDTPPLIFQAQNHDDLLAIAARLRAGTALAEDEANALAIGLKLFGGVLLAHRREPLFASIQPSMQAFIGQLKAQVAAGTANAAAANERTVDEGDADEGAADSGIAAPAATTPRA